MHINAINVRINREAKQIYLHLFKSKVSVLTNFVKDYIKVKYYVVVQIKPKSW